MEHPFTTMSADAGVELALAKTGATNATAITRLAPVIRRTRHPNMNPPPRNHPIRRTLHGLAAKVAREAQRPQPQRCDPCDPTGADFALTGRSSARRRRLG